MEAKTAKNLVLSLCLLVLSSVFIVGTVKVVQKGTRLIEAKKELEALERQKAALEKEAQYRKSPEFVEYEARNKLNMVKPGEEVYLRPKIMGDDLLGTGDARESSTPNLTNQSLFVRLFDKIKEFLLSFLG